MALAPYFDAFCGVKVFASYDIAVAHGQEVVVLDVKSGRRSDLAELECGEQLALLGSWAKRHYSTGLGNVRVQGVWLWEGAPEWSPQPLRLEQVATVAERVLREVREERARAVEVMDGRGRTIGWNAQRDDYPRDHRSNVA